LLLGNRPNSLRFIKEALSHQNIEILFKNLEDFDEPPTVFDNFDLVILDVSDLPPKLLTRIFDILHVLKNHPAATLALIPGKDTRLRYRFVESGVNDYLLTPFDKLDIQTRMRNLLKVSEPAYQETQVPSRSDRMPKALQHVSSFLDAVSMPLQDFEYDGFLHLLFDSIRSLLDVQYLLYFEVISGSEISLRYMIPDFPVKDDLAFPFDDIPAIVRSVRLKEVTILNQLNTENPLSTALKSFFNLDVKAYALYPVLLNNNVKALFLALRADNKKFHKLHSQWLAIAVNLIEFGLRLDSNRRQLDENLDAHVWQYSFEFLDHIINQLNFGIMVIDKNEKIKYLNETSADILQVDSSKSLYQPLQKILGSQNTKVILDARQPVEGTYERPEIEISAKDGSKILVGFSLTEIEDKTGNDGGIILSLKDITYSKELQEEMRRMDRLASLGVMASGIAHEIRNPLAGIKAIAQTFEEELAPEDPKNEFVKRIIKQVNRLDDMLKTLFSYAKPQKPNRQFHHIEEILREVLTLLKQKIQQQNIKLTQSYSSTLPPLFVDNSQVQQVLFNLILNSIEAIETGGEIHIAIESVGKEQQKLQRKPFYKTITGKPYVSIQISDNGCGIQREDLQQIFNPFFTTKNFGTGLGLSIVYQIVQENNGIIYFESEAKKGTLCYLFLPAFDTEEEAILEKKG